MPINRSDRNSTRPAPEVITSTNSLPRNRDWEQVPPGLSMSACGSCWSDFSLRLRVELSMSAEAPARMRSGWPTGGIRSIW
jgi:hypothetical protein